MALQGENEFIMEISDLSEHRHSADFLKDELLDVMVRNGMSAKAAIACVSDNPSSMVKMKNDLRVSNWCCVYSRY